MFDDRQHLQWHKGNVELIRGRQIVVAAEISNLRDDEIPFVTVSSLLENGKRDPEVKPWKASLRRQPDSELHWVRLPSSGIGLARSVRVTLEAGDARAEPFDVTVVDAPSLLVKKVRYIFPEYTGQPDQVVEWQGDLRAIEGTEAQLEVESNQPLDAAWINFLNTKRSDDLRLVVMSTNQHAATGVFRLRLAADRTSAEHSSYQLRFRSRSENSSLRTPVIDESLTHRIEVLPDLAPEVAIELPEADSERMPSRAAMRIRVRAIDPDYALSKVAVETRPEGSGLIQDKVLWQPDATGNQTNGDGEVRVSTRIVPAQDAPGAKVIEYRAVVYDNRKPEPNSTATTWRRLIIDEQSPAPKEPEELWPDRKSEPPSEKNPSRDVTDGSSGKTSPEEKPAQGTPEKQNSDDDSQAQRQTSETMSNNIAEEKDQSASGSAGEQEGQGQQTGMSSEENDGGSNGEPQATGNEGESNANRTDKTQETQSTESGSGQNESGARQRDSGSENSRSEKNEDEGARGQPQNDAKGNRDEMEADPLSADGVDDGEAIERILEHKRRESVDGNAQGRRLTSFR